MSLSSRARRNIDLARSGTLGRSFPTWDEMVREAEGDIKRLTEIFSRNYGRVSEDDVKSYLRIYRVDISSN
jgi:hypothetical protein